MSDAPKPLTDGEEARARMIRGFDMPPDFQDRVWATLDAVRKNGLVWRLVAKGLSGEVRMLIQRSDRNRKAIAELTKRIEKAEVEIATISDIPSRLPSVGLDGGERPPRSEPVERRDGGERPASSSDPFAEVRKVVAEMRSPSNATRLTVADYWADRLDAAMGKR